ncbi:MAG TPA: GNAT family N-acetyltransferase [Candidatus Acidoferrales bacterium]|nr:GNAT family N-acetyltransferase [Candidatus Acidoferrales bacterium]
MAARLHPEPAPQVIDLRRLLSRDLEPLLEQECAAWLEELEWDFSKSADLVRRFVDMRALSGSALVQHGRIVGYMYWVIEDDKGLIGDLYVSRDFRAPEIEGELFESALEPMIATPGVTRIESQLMMLPHAPARLVPRPEYASQYARNFMRIDLMSASLGRGRIRRPVYFEKWNDHYNNAAAELIAEAYTGHTDSRINDQYRSIAGARKFLYNIVQYPGCGSFYRPASFTAFEPLDGRLCGVSLASLVAEGVGHITQICVSPAARGTGVGHELLRLSLTALREIGCRSATLTVTSSNDDAVKLYERVGFETIRQFSAFVWEGF